MNEGTIRGISGKGKMSLDIDKAKICDEKISIDLANENLYVEDLD